MIRSWHIVISGFRQSEGEPNGCLRLFDKLNRFASPETRVELREWNARLDNLAEAIFRLKNGSDPIICLYGYSWGGYSAAILARDLDRRGIPVRSMVLADPVYRHWYALGQWRALVPWSRIVIPANVREVHWFRQMTDLPRGHKLVAQNGRNTVIHRSVILPGVSHAYMDDAHRFHDLSIHVASQAEASLHHVA